MDPVEEYQSEIARANALQQCAEALLEAALAVYNRDMAQATEIRERAAERYWAASQA